LPRRLGQPQARVLLQCDDARLPAVAFRKTQYECVDQLQRDMDRYPDLVFYNRERAHQGYRTKGRTPYQTFLDGIATMQEQEVNPEAA